MLNVRRHILSSSLMATLISIVPDVDVLVALAPEELAEIVLRLAHERRHNDLIHLQSIASDIHGSPAW